MQCMQYEARQLHFTATDIEVLDPRMLVPTVAANGQPDGGSRYALLQVGLCVRVCGCERPLMSGSEPAAQATHDALRDHRLSFCVITITGARHTALRLHHYQHHLVHPQAKCKLEAHMGTRRWGMNVCQPRWVEARQARAPAMYSRCDNDVYCFSFNAQVRSHRLNIQTRLKCTHHLLQLTDPIEASPARTASFLVQGEVAFTSSIAANLMDAMGLLSPGTRRVAAKPTPRLSYSAPDTSCTRTFMRAHIPEELVSTGESANVGLRHGTCGSRWLMCMMLAILSYCSMTSLDPQTSMTSS